MIKAHRPYRGFATSLKLLLALVLLLAAACGRTVPKPPEKEAPPRDLRLTMLGYAIQAGAFRNIDNAVRLCEDLKTKGLKAYYFIDTSSHLYKVRFGNFQNAKAAKKQADQARVDGLITEYYIVKPDSYAAARMGEMGTDFLRLQIVETARSFLGIPYKWGGESVDDGFDCSGLTMVSYQLNGLNLPRNSKEQYEAGRPVERDDLAPGDLVFFSTNGGKGVSHVGLYLGNGNFIHAPKQGATITKASLGNSYFGKCYLGGRSYM